MKKSVFYMLLMQLLFVSCTFSFEKKVYGKGDFSSVTVEAFADTIALPGVQLVDVRTIAEFEEGNIPGSINIDVKSGHFGEDALTVLDKQRTVAIYCRSGRRSKNAALILTEMGYNVVELDEGYNAWVKVYPNVQRMSRVLGVETPSFKVVSDSLLWDNWMGDCEYRMVIEFNEQPSLAFYASLDGLLHSGDGYWTKSNGCYCFSRSWGNGLPAPPGEDPERDVYVQLAIPRTGCTVEVRYGMW